MDLYRNNGVVGTLTVTMVMRLNERLSIERYYTFIQGKSTLWLTTMNHSLVAIVRVIKCV